MTAAAATAVVVGAGLPGPIVERLRGWLGWTGVAIAGVVCLHRLAPQVLESVSPRVNFVGATLGSQLVAATFLAAAMAAVAGDRGGHTFRRVAQLVAMTVAVAITGERSSLVLPLVAVGVALWRSRASVRRWAATLRCDPDRVRRVAHTRSVAAGRARAGVGRRATGPDGHRRGPRHDLEGRGARVGRAAPPRLGTQHHPHRLRLGRNPIRARTRDEEMERRTRSLPGDRGRIRDPGRAASHRAPVDGRGASPPIVAGSRVGGGSGRRDRRLLAGGTGQRDPHAHAVPVRWDRRVAPRRTWERSGTPTRGWRLAGFAAPALLTAAVAVAALQLTASALQQRGRDYADEGAFRLALQIQPWRLSAQEYWRSSSPSTADRATRRRLPRPAR